MLHIGCGLFGGLFPVDDGFVHLGALLVDKALDRDILLGVGVKLITIVQMQKTAGQNPLLLMRKDRRYSPEEITNLLEASGRSAGKGLVQKTLPVQNDAGIIVDGKEVQSGLRPLIPIFATMILFMIVMIGASPQLQGVIEEKMNRMGEVLLGSATPFQVLSGKLLGMTERSHRAVALISLNICCATRQTLTWR